MLCYLNMKIIAEVFAYVASKAFVCKGSGLKMSDYTSWSSQSEISINSQIVLALDLIMEHVLCEGWG